MSIGKDGFPQASLSAEVAEAGLHVVNAATDLCGDRAKALNFYRTELLAAFGFKTAEILVNEGRANDVLRYLESLSAGAVG